MSAEPARPETPATPAAERPLILVVEDDRGYRQLLLEELEEAGYALTGVADACAAQAVLANQAVALVLSDLQLPGEDGLAVLQATRALTPRPGFIMLTGFGTIDQAVAALKAGADDFLTKPVDLEHLRLAVARVLENRQLQAEVARYRQVLAGGEFHGMLGKSPAMRALYDLIRRIAQSDSSVLITGESGTGKELVARALHAESPRAAAPFVALNCAGIPESLLESELLGHAAGAFSGARGARQGLFVEADGGTLFLDEIAEMPTAMQTKLLRLLQDGRVRPVGANREISTDVRIVAATHRDIGARIAEGQFREDLFYRLETFRIQVPPLRDRGDDIAALLQRFLESQTVARERPARRFAPEAWRALLRYRYPGNVRELENLVERAVTLAPDVLIGLEDLPECVRAEASLSEGLDQSAAALDSALILASAPASMAGALAQRASAPQADEDWQTLAEVEARYIRSVLEWTQGNKQRAAKILGIGRKTLYRKLDDEQAGS
ncbi:sigma-54-dependent transcriptional regulator [Halochromatium roseum]|uniref:sigma-54-dependent transcriptional regulator n=1 Tax=Halochromatium roseum TaxID=391920 RepID=UPI001911F9E1|nr:sigma-54 dependent transcriptional regulator [Halochromatium roseum]MBK5940629.1 sigma-54-dependent Fis family transcriptional regulator [Halochromatium roseum]